MTQNKSKFNFLRLAALALFAGLGGWAVMAQWPANPAGEEPYIAEGRLRFLLLEPGSNTGEQRSFAIVAARDRLGNLYHSQERPQGKLVNLWVEKTGVQYLIDYAQKTVQILGQTEIHPSDPRVRARAAAEVSSEREPKQVAGLDCVPEPVFGLQEGRRVQAGEKCYATDPAGLLLSSISESALQGKTLRQDMEITSVRRGAEPDASWFEVPGDFQVIKRTGR